LFIVCSTCACQCAFALAPRSAGFDKDSEIFQAAQARQWAESLTARFRAMIDAADGIEEKMDLVRAIYAIRDGARDNRRAEEFIAGSGLPADSARQAASRVAADFIESAILGRTRTMTSSLPITNPGRLASLDEFLFSPSFRFGYFDLSEGARSLVDFGTGSPPFTTSELAFRAKKLNPRAVTVGVDKYRNVHTVTHSKSGRMVLRAEDMLPPSDAQGITFIQGSFDFEYQGKADLIRAMNVLMSYPRKDVLAAALVEFERKLKEGGVLLSGVIPDKDEFGFCLVMRKEKGVLTPAEIVLTGLVPAKIRKEAILSLEKRAAKFGRDIGAFGVLDDGVMRDMSEFFTRFMREYVKRANDVGEACGALLTEYRCMGYRAAYDERMGIVRIGCSPRDVERTAGVRSVARLLRGIGNECDERARYLIAMPSVPLALLPSVCAEAARRGMTVDQFERFCGTPQGGGARADLAGKLTLAAGAATDPQNMTWFFRAYGSWGPLLREYLRAAIPYKLSRGDRTLVVKSVGSSTGEEGCSVGLVVYDALRSYAEDAVCRGIADPQARRAAADAWISSWDVRIELFDANIDNLRTALSGEYVFGESEVPGPQSRQWEDIGAVPLEVRSLLTASRTADGEYERKVDDRVRRWIVPVFVDLESVNAALTIAADKADIVFCRNAAMYLSEEGRQRLTAVLKNSLSARSPAFCFADRGLVAFGEAWVFIPPEVIADGQRQRDAGVLRCLANALWTMVEPLAPIAPALMRDPAVVDILSQVQRGGYLSDEAYTALVRAYSSLDPERPQLAQVVGIADKLGRLPLPQSADPAVSSIAACAGDA